MSRTSRARTIGQIGLSVLALAIVAAIFLPGLLGANRPLPTPAATGHHPSTSTSASPRPAPAPAASTAVTVSGAAMGLLAELVIAPEDTGAHYDKDLWREDWDTHPDGCTTRERVLFRDSKGSAQRGKGCVPICPDSHPEPCWTSPYDNQPYRDRAKLQIDHVVPIGEVPHSRVINPDGTVGLGAARVWTEQQRHQFYQDESNLLAVTGTVNQSKGDRDPGEWRPANTGSWCQVATITVHTKVTYRLTVDQAEHDALDQMLRTCPTDNG